MAVEPAEPSGGQGFIDGRKVLHPWISFCYATGEPGQFDWKLRVDQIRVARPAAMVNETDDWPDAEIAKHREAPIAPPPIQRPVALLHSLPQNRIPHSLDAQSCYALKIVEPMFVTGTAQLLKILVMDTVLRAFHASPEFQRSRHPVFRTPG